MPFDGGGAGNQLVLRTFPSQQGEAAVLELAWPAWEQGGLRDTARACRRRYIIEEGSAVASIDGRDVYHFKSGEYFGELALISVT